MVRNIERKKYFEGGKRNVRGRKQREAQKMKTSEKM
jgi:hypothetical protein